MRRGARSLRDTMLANKRALDYMADNAQKPRMNIAIPPPPRQRKPSGKPLERDVVRAVMDMLRRHPKVGFVHRLQSGLLDQGERMIRVGSVGMPDLCGVLKGGRAFYIEIKTADGVVTDAQNHMIDILQHAGAACGIARSVEQALAIIEGRDTK